MPEEELGDIELIGLIEGTVKDLKEYVRDRHLDNEQLEKLLRAERNAKNRKTAKQFLRKRMDVHQEVEETEKIDREELLKILGGTVEDMKEYVKEKDPSDSQLQEILHAEKVVNDRKTAVRFLKSYSKKEELKEDIKKAEHDFRELREDLDRIEREVLDEDIELTGIDIEGDEEEDSEEDKEEEETGDAEESDESDEEEDEDSEQEEADEEGEESEEHDDEEKDEETEDEELSELERKKEIVESLEVEMGEEELEDISLEELKSIRDEKVEREELIDYLEDEFDNEKLRDASTEDLRKLKRDLDDTEDEDPSEKEGEEIKEEAQEDLEMLMGAVKGKEDEEEKKDRLSGIKNLRSNIKEKLNFGSDEEEEDDDGFKKEDIIDLLEEYGELGKYEAAIKTAHIMKGYLEYSESIDRELTYKELTEEIEANSEAMETLLEFFDDMHKDQYTGDITADMDEVIDASKKVVNARE